MHTSALVLLLSIVFPSGQSPPTPSWSTVNNSMQLISGALRPTQLPWLPDCQYLLTLLPQSYDGRQHLILFWTRCWLTWSGQFIMTSLTVHLRALCLDACGPVWTEVGTFGTCKNLGFCSNCHSFSAVFSRAFACCESRLK